MEEKSNPLENTQAPTTFERFLHFLFPGAGFARRLKIGIFFFTVTFSGIGLVIHYLALIEEASGHKGEHATYGPFWHFYGEISIHVFAGYVLFILLDITFHNIEKWYGTATRFKYDEYIGLIEKIEKNKEINILSTFISMFSETKKKDNEEHSDYNQRKSKDRRRVQRFVNAVRDAIDKKNASVKFLILEPVSFSARQRQLEFDEAKKNEKDEEDIRNLSINVISEIIITLNALNNIFNDTEREIIKERFQIRIYNRIPPFSLFQAGDTCSMGFYPYDKTNTKTTHFKFYEKSVFNEEFIKKKFNELWGGDIAIEQNTHANVLTENQYNYFYSINDYLFTEFIYNKDKLSVSFVDIYDRENGFIFERKLLVIFLGEKLKVDLDPELKLEIKYRGQKRKAIVKDKGYFNNQMKDFVDFEGDVIKYATTLMIEKYSTDGKSIPIECKDNNCIFLEIESD